MASSISVAVRVRPLTEKEKNQLIPTQSSSSGIFSDGCLTSASNNQSSSISAHKSLRSIVKVLDDRVLIFDPAESNPIQQAQRQILARFSSKPSPSPSNTLNHHSKKVKDMRFCFDRVFNENASQEDVYHGAAKDLIDGVLGGFNATVFAYGATGCGKTHTITGTPEAPGIVYLLMKDLFGRIADQEEDTTTEISISYLEIYNETIRDLLNPNAPILNLREANSSVSVPGLSTLTPTSASDVITVISSGNSHRTVHGTEANAVSSRSHAVMSVNIRRKPKTAGLIDDWTVATLSVIDLAGSERASVTKNKGERLLEGANINKSLLALGNCINALCDPKGRGNHVPYRNSKLTRLLKHSLGGNCRTLMIVCVAPTSAHYDETHNTLQYANRAKEIKTKVTRNIISVDRHVSQYVQVIFQLRQELEERKKNEAVKEDRLRKEISHESMFSADQSSILLDLPSHSTEKILSTAILEGKPSASSPEKPTVETRANESSSSTGGGRSNRMKAGYLSRNNKAGKSGRTMMVSTLDSLGEEEEEEEGEEGDLTVKAAGENKPMTAQRVTLPSSFSFSGFTLPPSNLSNYPMAEDAPPTRRTTLSSTNTNSNTGNTDSQAGSTKSVARAGRRDSAVGPIRHSKPTAALRRRSLNIYHREPSVSGERSRAPAGLGSTGSSTGSISSTITTTNTKNEFPRRASRVPLINSSLILSSSLSGSGTSSGPGRSPRKAAARSLLGSAASSTLPPASNTRTRLAARRSMATLQSAKPSLSSSHLLHHDHTGLSSSSSTTTNNNPSGNGSNSIRPRRISLLPTPINNPNFSFSSSSSSANNSQIHHPPDGAGANGSICLPNKKDLFGGPSLSSSSTTGAAGNGSASSNHSSHHVWR
ncbi:kinesin family member 18/19 [Puccinia graminis f. sp. tritici CRL 75-36-700-3]|uniref:Kinesin-like protein n=1 Tax=Puccinia graminis f. sp. tritici (strain CRL 75-36-700-3 / race SCCL) TaxID=418459 RepID=H6QSI6_PUCGT|nr:kinesin family member 18/19 [Puccinia graminis f. sp. tritici CRL 75-36-700-3]EHS63723.1 kinesin family member 18/19 [Puccinia graminis f. sp. tritici CRL 75-36-700-3]